MTATGTVIGLQNDRVAAIQQLTDLDHAIQNSEYLQISGTHEALVKTHRDYLNRIGEAYIACRAALDEAKIAICKSKAETVGPRPPKPTIALVNQTP